MLSRLLTWLAWGFPPDPGCPWPDRPDLHVDTYDPMYGSKLADARGYLGRLDRGRTGSEHRYINSEGKETKP